MTDTNKTKHNCKIAPESESKIIILQIIGVIRFNHIIIYILSSYILTLDVIL